MTDDSNNHNTTDEEPYSTGVRLIWHRNRRIAEFDMSEFTLKRPVVDDFIERVKDYAVDNCPDGLVLTLYNFSAHKMPPFSSYFRQRSQEATNQVPERFYGRSAVLLHQSPLTQLYRLVLRAMTLAKQADHRVERQVFLNRDRAMAWLEELLDDSEQEKPSEGT